MIPAGAVVGYFFLLAGIGISFSDRFYIALYPVIVVTIVAGTKAYAERICGRNLQLFDFY